jgi:tetratricopeptide (TPR) repeat protein
LSRSCSTRIASAVEELNRAWDLLPEKVPVRAVLWLSDRAADALASGARDLYDVALTFFRFEFREWPRAVTPHESLPAWIYLARPEEEPRLRREASLLERVVEKARQPRAIADAAARIGQIKVLLGDAAQGEVWLRRAIDAFREDRNASGEALVRLRLGDLRRLRGDLDAAMGEYQAVIEVYQNTGEARGRAIALGQIADILQARGQLDEALRIRQEEQLPVYERLGLARDLLVAQAKTAIILLARKEPADHNRARELLCLALAAAEKLRIPEAEQIREILGRENLTCP